MNKNSEVIGNNILDILGKKGISIRKMANDLVLDYSYTYNLVHRESLATVQLATVVKIAGYLEVKIEDLYN